jgi:predicted enzyme related to lactoylglutathione lyase
MNNYNIYWVYITLLLILIIGCNEENHQTVIQPEIKSVLTDTTPRVTGLGGIFFFSDNPSETKKWYAENLGLEVNEWGSSFEFRNAYDSSQINYLQWSPFKTGASYFSPSNREFMVNYRVHNIESLIIKLRNNGVTILDSIDTYDYGKFIHIMDLDGTKIELWEPVDSVFTAMGGRTTK